MEQFFVALSTISFLSFKQMLDAVTNLDGKLMNLHEGSYHYEGFAKFLRFIYFLSKISFIEFSFMFPNKILNLILNFFMIFFINVKLSLFKI